MDANAQLNVVKNLITQQACFAQFTPEELNELAHLFTLQIYKRGEVIVTEGDPVESIFLVFSGTADVRQAYIKDGKIETKSVATLGPNESIGLNETGFYSLTGKRTATVIAMTEMICYKLNLAEFHGFALSHSHVSELMRKNAESMSSTDS